MEGCASQMMRRVLVVLLMCVTLLCVSLASSQSLGDEFATLPVYGRFAEIIEVTTDLAIPGNILVLNTNGDLYTTSNNTNFKMLTTEYMLEMDQIPAFIQLSPNFIVFMTLKDSCLCQLERIIDINPRDGFMDRIPKKITPVHVSNHNCKRNCNINTPPLFSVYSLFQYQIFSDVRDSSYLFTADSADGQNPILRHYSLPSRGQKVSEDNNNLDSIRSQQQTFSEYELLFASHSNHTVNSYYEQINDHIFTASEDKIWRGKLPSLEDYNPHAQRRSILFAKISGSVGGDMDGPFKQASYFNNPGRLTRINDTMLALSDSNRIRLLDLSTNTTSSLCLTGSTGSKIYFNTNGRSPSSCALPTESRLFFVDNSLYVTMRGGWGWIYHSDAAKTGQTDGMDEGGTQVIIIVVSVVSLFTILGILSGAVVYVWYKRKGTSNIREGHRNGLGYNSPNDAVILSSRELPSPQGNIVDDDHDECYDMPYVDDGDIYDMIGDQDYDMIRDSEESAAVNDQMTSSEETEHYVDNTIIPNDSEVDIGSTLNLDKYGYMKPRSQATTKVDKN